MRGLRKKKSHFIKKKKDFGKNLYNIQCANPLPGSNCKIDRVTDSVRKLTHGFEVPKQDFDGYSEVVYTQALKNSLSLNLFWVGMFHRAVP